jgi:two-component system chemotaxis sensor kinase CheA
VECAGERYAIPQVAVRELVSIDSSGPGVEFVAGAPVYRLRGRLLPLVRLDDALGLVPRPDLGTAFLAVVQAEGRRFGLVVDRVLNTEEIVVKPMSARVKSAGAYAGATILGDGRVALILDVQAIARQNRVSAEGVPTVDDTAPEAATAEVVRLLVASVGGRRVAVPLEAVTRLEEFAVESIEHVGQREVVQYRGHIMPLVRLSHLLGCQDDPEQTSLPVVVYSEGGRHVALAVGRIEDIVDNVVDRDADPAAPVGSTVIQQKVTEMLEVRSAILSADPYFFDRPEPSPEADADDRGHHDVLTEV